MADPSPADADAEGQEPEAGEGQKPAGDADVETGQTPSSPRQYPEAYVRQLRREASGYRSKLTELEERVRDFEDRDKSEQERLAGKMSEAEKRATDAEARLLRYEVAAERGLDISAAGFLTGSTREEIEHRADELAKLLETRAKPAGGFDAGARQPVTEPQTPEKAHNDLILQSLGRGRRA